MDDTIAHVRLDDRDAIGLGRLPPSLRPDARGFDAIWALRPERFHRVKMFGREVDTPRWQQAFGRDYRYSGGVNEARPFAPALEPLLAWAREAIDPRLNAALLNWYDGALGHYMGPHRDDTRDMVPGSPIVGVSLGASRTYRLERWRPGPGEARRVDVTVDDGAVVVTPFDVNARWTHAVPKRAGDAGRRVSITFRAFVGAAERR